MLQAKDIIQCKKCGYKGYPEVDMDEYMNPVFGCPACGAGEKDIKVKA